MVDEAVGAEAESGGICLCKLNYNEGLLTKHRSVLWMQLLILAFVCEIRYLFQLPNLGSLLAILSINQHFYPQDYPLSAV